MLRALQLWDDDVARDGFGNMAVDDWLLETAEAPVLRIYGWSGGWGSFGYFVPSADAARSLPGLQRVRRRTGGGIVDHREDWTYTVVVPRNEKLANLRGGDSYRFVHAALARALGRVGIAVGMAAGQGPVAGGECFVRPADHDLLDEEGRKIAGAGQRRAASGLLHQGSLAIDPGPGFGEILAAELFEGFQAFGRRPGEAEIVERSRLFRSREWSEWR